MSSSSWSGGRRENSPTGAATIQTQLNKIHPRLSLWSHTHKFTNLSGLSVISDLITVYSARSFLHDYIYIYIDSDM